MPESDQGVDLTRYMLVPRTLIFITRGNQILLLKGLNNKRLWAGLYNGIGGHIEKGEDIYSAALRELQEESGLTSNNLKLRGILTVDTRKNPGVCVFIFSGTCQEEKYTKSDEGLLEWIKLSDLDNIPLVEDLPLLLPKVLDPQEANQIFFAHSEYDRNGKLTVSFS
jgi:8-oxo-dGTP diphosphatase